MPAHSEAHARALRASTIRRRTVTRAPPTSTIPVSAPAPAAAAFRAMWAWSGGASAALPSSSTHTRIVSPLRVAAGTRTGAVCVRWAG